MVFSGFPFRKIFVISFYKSSGIRIIVLTYFLLLVKYLTHNIAKLGAIFISIFGLGLRVSSSLVVVLTQIGNVHY